MRILALLLASVIGFGLIFLLRATVDFHYLRQGENDHLELKMTAAGGLWKFKFEIPSVQMEWEEGPQLEFKEQAQAAMGEKRRSWMNVRFRYFRQSFFYYIWPRIPRILRYLQSLKRKFYRGIHCTFLDWRVGIGCEDAAYTAVLTGSFWSMLGFFLAKLYRQVTMDTKQPHILVTPDFNKPGFSYDFHCIFKLRLGHIMVVGLDLVGLFLPGKKGKD